MLPGRFRYFPVKAAGHRLPAVDLSEPQRAICSLKNFVKSAQSRRRRYFCLALGVNVLLSLLLLAVVAGKIVVKSVNIEKTFRLDLLDRALGESGLAHLSAVLPARESTGRFNGAEAMRVSHGNRAVTLVVDQTASVEGFVQPGVWVDVTGTYVDDQGVLKTVAVAQNSKVLSYKGRLQAERESAGRREAGGAATVTIETSLEEALKIVMLRQYAALALLLRAPQDFSPLGVSEIQSWDIQSVFAPPPDEPLNNAAWSSRFCPSHQGSSVPMGTRISKTIAARSFGFSALNNCVAQPLRRIN